MISAVDLNQYVDNNINTICGNGYTDPNDNHCAHFVCHALGYTFGYTCQNATGKKKEAANLRVQELFSQCPSVGRWEDKPDSLKTCIVFVTAKSNVDIGNKSMTNVPRKHVGIFIDGTIWHYSNANHRVMTQVPGDFVHHYSGSDIALFYGSMP